MLSDFAGADKVYIACGYTDLRRGIDGLAGIVQQQFQLDPFSNTLFLFCGRRRDRIKAKEPAVLHGNFASPEAIAHIMVQKYVMYSPLYRLEQEFMRQGCAHRMSVHRLLVLEESRLRKRGWKLTNSLKKFLKMRRMVIK
ncbi:MAG: IS66 family insertion sequence element accessory protein TnpB [Clostridiales bacterium]|nr:IS66 family insertion sequence element accessory protein TnpB [Candidatus Cacconaster stercorequi]